MKLRFDKVCNYEICNMLKGLIMLTCSGKSAKHKRFIFKQEAVHKLFVVCYNFSDLF